MTREETVKALKKTLHELRQYETATEELLNRAYRKGGWTARQIINHIADGDIAFYWRFCRCAAGEDGIQLFDQDRWVAELEEDTRPVSISVAQIEAVRRGFIHYVETLSDEKLDRAVQHPEFGSMSALKIAGLVTLHARHHLGQLKAISENREWSEDEAVSYH